jgi:hypothetical protein
MPEASVCDPPPVVSIKLTVPPPGFGDTVAVKDTGVAVPFTLVNTVPELPPLIVVVVEVAASTVKLILHCPSDPLPAGEVV